MAGVNQVQYTVLKENDEKQIREKLVSVYILCW